VGSRRSRPPPRAAGGFGNPDLPPEGAVNVTNPKALTDPGPQDPGLAGYEPSFLNPPATDVNGMPQFWASFNLAPKRIQNGGWARQITQADFQISTDIAGVNMRLGPGGVRDLRGSISICLPPGLTADRFNRLAFNRVIRLFQLDDRFFHRGL
jgi:hypothetical protein